MTGIRVVLMPWGPCAATPPPSSITPENDGCPTPLPSPQTTTKRDGTFTLGDAPNGRYLLVIGNDTVSTPPPGYSTPAPCGGSCPAPTAAPFTVIATIHDNVTLTGGTQSLHAPSLPPVPTITPHAWETNGSYRIATLDATTEMPCYIAWQYERKIHNLPESSVDEWLTENVRAVNAFNESSFGGSAAFLTSGNIGNTGGTDCASSLINTAFQSGGLQYATNYRTVYFSSQYRSYVAGSPNSASGIAEFLVDPRSLGDPEYPNWP